MTHIENTQQAVRRKCGPFSTNIKIRLRGDTNHLTEGLSFRGQI